MLSTSLPKKVDPAEFLFGGAKDLSDYGLTESSLKKDVRAAAKAIRATSADGYRIAGGAGGLYEALVARQAEDAKKIFTYELWDEDSGDWYDTCRAHSAEDALDIAEERAGELIDWHSIWREEKKTQTVFFEIAVRDEDGEVHERPACPVHPPAPACYGDRRHEWEKSGPWGSGGSVMFRYVCKNCGLHKTDDGWGMRRDTGRQGLDVITYWREQPEERDYDRDDGDTY